MQPNVGIIDRLLRFLLGIGFVGVAFSDSTVLGGGIVQYAAFAIGIVLIVTATLRICPLYRVLGIRTCDCADDG